MSCPALRRLSMATILNLRPALALPLLPPSRPLATALASPGSRPPWALVQLTSSHLPQLDAFLCLRPPVRMLDTIRVTWARLPDRTTLRLRAQAASRVQGPRCMPTHAGTRKSSSSGVAGHGIPAHMLPTCSARRPVVCLISKLLMMPGRLPLVSLLRAKLPACQVLRASTTHFRSLPQHPTDRPAPCVLMQGHQRVVPLVLMIVARTRSGKLVCTRISTVWTSPAILRRGLILLSTPRGPLCRLSLSPRPRLPLSRPLPRTPWPIAVTVGSAARCTEVSQSTLAIAHLPSSLPAAMVSRRRQHPTVGRHTQPLSMRRTRPW